MARVNQLKPSERMKIPRQKSLEQSPDVRSGNFEEVSHGLTEPDAQVEATRCLECHDPVCITGCPVNIDILSFIQRMMVRDYAGALAKIREANLLPAICGRVCPQESQCEAVCTLGIKHEPVAIGKLERFLADYERKQQLTAPTPVLERTDRRVAIVGSGPAGLTCAAELARIGHRVTIFEALHAAGGVLRYGIPEFRLPRRILDAEIEGVKSLGVEVVANFLVGRTATIDELFDDWGFDAVFLASGAGTPHFLNMPGENLIGVYSANEFLTRVNLMHAGNFPTFDTPLRISRAVAVIGGGNTAMDAVRTARRLGAGHALLVYRRSREEMPARAEEVAHAEEEGIQFMFLTNPTRVLGTDDHRVRGLECQRMRLGEPDASGRRRPVPIPDSTFVVHVDTVIEAVGQSPNPILQKTTTGLSVGKNGTVDVDAAQQTSRKGVFAGGDLSRGGATVILAMRDGKLAAASINQYLSSLPHRSDGRSTGAEVHDAFAGIQGAVE